MADAQASGACGRKIVWVQVPSPALFFCLFDHNNDKPVNHPDHDLVNQAFLFTQQRRSMQTPALLILYL